jgi:hypothetical protein
MTNDIPRSLRLAGGKQRTLHEWDRQLLAATPLEHRTKVLDGLRFAYGAGLVRSPNHLKRELKGLDAADREISVLVLHRLKIYFERRGLTMPLVKKLLSGED